MIPCRKSVLARCAAALMLVPLLSGCVAAVAVPLMTVVGAISERNRNRARALAELPAANAEAVAVVPERQPRIGDPAVQLTALRELPAPSAADMATQAPWRDFVRYTLEQATGLAERPEARSALLTPEGVATFRTELRLCERREPAVVIDLDAGETMFSPAPDQRPSADAADAAARLRAAGVIVLWVSQASANEVAGVAAALKNSGLDPTGRDPILLVRNEDERKQVLREEANESVCVLAVAGDQRSDFDELFDFLRDPALGATYEAQLGRGWFLVPPLFVAGAPQPLAEAMPDATVGAR